MINCFLWLSLLFHATLIPHFHLLFCSTEYQIERMLDTILHRIKKGNKIDLRKEWKLADYLNIVFFFSSFFLVGMKWANSVWMSLEKSFREKMEEVFGGAVLIVYRRLVRSHLLTAKGTLSAGHRTAVSRGVELNPHWSRSNAKRSLALILCSSSSSTQIRRPRLPADALMCSLAAALSFLTALTSKEKKHIQIGATNQQQLRLEISAKKPDSRLLFFFEKPSLLVVEQHKWLPRQAPAEPWSVTAAQFLYPLHKNRGLLWNKRCCVNPSAEPFLLLLSS